MKLLVSLFRASLLDFLFYWIPLYEILKWGIKKRRAYSSRNEFLIRNFKVYSERLILVDRGQNLQSTYSQNFVFIYQTCKSPSWRVFPYCKPHETLESAGNSYETDPIKIKIANSRTMGPARRPIIKKALQPRTEAEVHLFFFEWTQNHFVAAVEREFLDIAAALPSLAHRSWTFPWH